MLFFDAHLDLAMNALEWNRDLTRPLGLLRERERGQTDKPDRGRGTVCLPEMRRGGVALCVATLIARVEHNAFSPVFGWASPAQAFAQSQGQLAWYRAMEDAGEMVPLKDAEGLEQHLHLWGDASREAVLRERPIGYILSLEGADSILSMRHLEQAWAQGLRAVGPAHYGPGVYAMGTDASGGFNSKGRELLKEMDRLGMILDVTHLSDECFGEALDLYQGPVWASHSNCRSLVPAQRQLSDEQIKLLIERGAVIGAALDAWMMIPNWIRGRTTPEATGLKLATLCEHIDHVCQLAGNALHSGIGTDLDGAFGREQCPLDVDTIADLGRLPELLSARGFSVTDSEGIASGNFIRFLRGAWSR